MGEKRKQKFWYIFYPENDHKKSWDLLIALILIISCSVTPMQIAFYENNDTGAWKYIEVIFDILFGIDIIFNFMSAYYDDEFKLETDYKCIAANYIRSWLLIDVIAIFPFAAF